ncbi:hypothetical protein MKW92_030158 [Papaver armeniacum]|nr:hypothetical protein MKW92_030158 [Papaver armeniacum]
MALCHKLLNPKVSGKRLSSFSSINLAGNELSSSIPFSICSRDSKSNPQYINLSNNKFFGVIPTSIGYSRKLVSLNLGNNNLTGNVPNELQQLKSLSYLQLNDNILDGTPLNFISKLPELQVLNLANNHFEGSIPSAFGSAIQLSILSLRSNKFNGSIPQQITHLEELQILDLSGNNLNGLIPRKIGNLMMLRSRDGSSYLNNSLLCGFYTNNTCEVDRRTEATDGNSPNEDDKEDAKDKLLLYAIVALGFAVGFWGLFFVLLLKKQKWWFPYWRLVNVVAVGVANCMWKN